MAEQVRKTTATEVTSDRVQLELLRQSFGILYKLIEGDSLPADEKRSAKEIIAKIFESENFVDAAKQVVLLQAHFPLEDKRISEDTLKLCLRTLERAYGYPEDLNVKERMANAKAIAELESYGLFNSIELRIILANLNEHTKFLKERIGLPVKQDRWHVHNVLKFLVKAITAVNIDEYTNTLLTKGGKSLEEERRKKTATKDDILTASRPIANAVMIDGALKQSLSFSFHRLKPETQKYDWVDPNEVLKTMREFKPVKRLKDKFSLINARSIIESVNQASQQQGLLLDIVEITRPNPKK